MAMRVKIKSTGQSVAIDEKDFNPAVFEPIGSGNSAPQANNSSTSDKVGNFLLDIIKPFTNTGQRVGGAGAELVRLGLMGAGKNEAATFTNPFLKTEEDINKAKDPLQIAKDSAGVLAYGVPAKGLLGSKGAGYLTAGGMSGFGASEQEDATGLLGDTALGAGAGFATGKVLDKLLGGGIAKTGDSLRKGVTNPKVTRNIGMMDEEAVISSTLDGLGITGSSQAKLSKLPEAMSKLEKQAKQSLTGKTIPTARVVKTINDRLDDTLLTVDTKTRDKLMENLVKKANQGDTGINLSDRQLREFKRFLSRKTSNIWDKLKKNTPLSDAEDTALALWGAIDDALDVVNPSLGEITKKQSILFKAVKGLDQGRNQKVKIPVLGNEVSARPLQAIQDIMGRSLQSAGGATSSVPQAVPQGASILAGMGIVGGAEQAPMADMQTPSQLPYQGQDTGTQVDPELQKIVMSLKILDPKNAKMYDSLIATASGGRDLPAAQVSALGDIENSIQIMNGLGDTLASYADVMGPVSGRVRGLNPYDTDAQAFNAEMKTTAQLVGKAMEGGVLRKEDEEKYRKMLPQISDTPQVAAEKIRIVQEMLSRQKAIKEQEYKGYGFSGNSTSNNTDIIQQLLDSQGYAGQ